MTDLKVGDLDLGDIIKESLEEGLAGLVEGAKEDFDKFIMAFFLSSTESTLPIYMWTQLRFPQKLPGVLALGSIILVVSFIVVFVSQWLRGRGVAQNPGGDAEP